MNPIITKRCSPIEEAIYQDGFQAGAASRDAEVARLKTVPMRYRRMAFNAQLQDEVARLEQENDQLRADVAELKEHLETERIRLAACGVAALGYFDGCKDEYRSASLDDTLRLVEKNDQLRAEIAELEGKNYLNSNALRLQKEKNDQLRARVNVLLEALADTLYFLERHSNRWDGINGKHPNEVACTARYALSSTPEQSLAEYQNKVIEAFVNEFSRHVGGDGEFWLHELQDFAMKEQQ